MKQLICLVGLPLSGKTTWARGQGFPIVNPDSVRYAVYGHRFWAPGERILWGHVWCMVRALFLAGHEEVILDATNTTRKRRDECVKEGQDFIGDPALLTWLTVFQTIPTEEHECINRAISAEDEQIVPVIQKMARQFEALGQDELVYDQVRKGP